MKAVSIADRQGGEYERIDTDTTGNSTDSVLCRAEARRETVMLGVQTMRITWKNDDGETQGVIAPLEIWLGQILGVLSDDQRRVVIDNVREMTEEENERRDAAELEAAESEFDAEHG